jgi:hypothetical protein
MVDCSMMQFLPWKASLVYAESRGFPSLQLLRWCLGTDTVQVTVSVMCQIIFLTSSSSEGGETNNDNTSAQLKALFAMNITSAVLGVVWGMAILYAKESLLSMLESEEEGDKAKNGLVVVNSGGGGGGGGGGEGEGEGERELSVADVYGNPNGDTSAELEMADVVNPMMMMMTTTRVGAAAATAAAGNKLSAKTDDGDDDGDTRRQVSKLSERRARLERKLDEALAQKALAEHRRSQLEQDNARLKGVQGVAVL